MFLLRSIKKQGSLMLLAASASALIGCSGPKAAGPGPTAGGPPTGEAPPPVPIEKRPMEAFKAAVTEFTQAEKTGWNPSVCSSVISKFSDVVSRDARFPEALYNQGVAFDRCGKPKEADGAYRKAVQINPKFAPALVNIGAIYFRAGNVQLAEQYFNQAVTADPKNAEAHYNIAVMLRRNGGKSTVVEAQKHLRATLAIDAKNMPAYAALAKLYYDLSSENRNFLELAQLVCEQGRKVNPNYAPLYNVYGLIWLGKKNVTAAMQQFKKAVGLDPNYADAHMNIGAISLNFRDYPTAETSFTKVLAMEPNNVDAMVGLGVAFRGEGKPADAKRVYEKALGVAKNNASIYFNLGVLHQDYLSEGNPQILRQAQKYFEDYMRLDSGNVTKSSEARDRIKTIEELIAAMKSAPPPTPAPKGAPAAPTAAPAPAAGAKVNVNVNVNVGGKK